METDVTKRKNKVLSMVFIQSLWIVVLIAFDQFTKYLTLTKLKGNEAITLIKGVLEFDYVENRGSAFGIMQNQKILILAICFVCMIVVVYCFYKIPLEKKYNFLRLLLGMIFAGGIGNMIDRIRLEYVVDFISFTLIDFPVFNVADCYIVIATFVLAFLFIFVYKDEDLEFLSFKKKTK